MSPGRPPCPPATPSYFAALEAAYALGLEDGRLAARLGLRDEPSAVGATCRGRDPDDFASLLWPPGQGNPPSGLPINAPLWYAQGFRDAARASRASTSRPGRAPARGDVVVTGW